MLIPRLAAPALCLALLVLPAFAEPAKPRADYAAAARFGSKALAPMIHSTAVTPGFVGKTDTFWYAYRTSAGTSYWIVDPEKKTRSPLFDHDKLASQLAELSRRPAEAGSLPIIRGQISADGNTFTFVSGTNLFAYDRAAAKLADKGKAPPPSPFPGDGFGKGKGKRKGSDDAQDEEADEPQDDKTKGKGKGVPRPVPSPDKSAALYVKDHDLYLSFVGREGPPLRLTKDGGEDSAYTIPTGFAGFGPTGPLPPRSPWSKDSRHFYGFRQDSRGVKELFVINSLASPRPELEKYKYSMPGEPAIRKTELYVGSREGKTVARVEPKWKDESYRDIEWDRVPGELRFVRSDRLARNLELCALEVDTGKTRTLIKEGFENAPVEYQSPRHLEGGDFIWWSERTGWGHFYLYGKDGKLKNAITSGAWRASQIVAVDEKGGVLYVRGNAREKGENVYYAHLYSVKLDGTGLTLLDPGDAHHFTTLSPTRKFVIDNTSRVDEAPTSVVRDAKGNKVMDLEKCDLSQLKEQGWKAPEAFKVKAADGVTELYGNMWRPFNFDPKRKYPIIANVYPGPQTEGVTHTFSAYSQNMQLAQLGFIVIQVGHRGGSPGRSKAYASYGYFNLRDYGLEDKKKAIEQLAARHPFIDIDKVGIFGHSGGGFMSAAALLQKPYNEFFKAAVASAGNHDNNIYNNYWAERYHGMREVVDIAAMKEGMKDATKRPPMTPAAPPVKAEARVDTKPAAPPTKFEIKVPTNAELAANLKGRLLLVHGEIDNNVHPANTMRLVDALIKAHKRFDLLILPGKRHGYGDYSPYFNKRMWEFFAEHLLGDRRSGADLLEGE